MITIYSRTNDATTTEVIKWIEKLDNNIKVVRIDSDAKSLEFISFNEKTGELLFKIGAKTVNLLDSIVNWYRKGGFMFEDLLKSNLENDYFNDNNHFIKSHLKRELNVIIEFLGHISETKKYSLGSRFNATLNKLIILDKAKKQGLDIPLSFINNSKDLLRQINKDNGDLITKALSDGVYTFGTNMAFYSYTEKINQQSIDGFTDNFFPSLFQLQIKKKFEVRSFFLDRKFYSMAIFSQSNLNTQVDFRRYDNTKPNRNVPYKLPVEIENKLICLFDDIDLNTGSVDLIVDENDNHIFLEINPVGQFTMTSIPCNYLLEKKVAKLLVDNYKETLDQM